MSNLRPADAEAERGLTGQEARNSDRVEPRGEEDSDSVEYPEDEAESGEEADDSDEQELGPHPHDDGQHPAHAHAPHPTQPGNGNDWRMQKESATSQDQSALLPRPDANPREETHLATSGDPNRSLDRPDKAVEHVEPDRDPDDADDFEDEGGRRQVVDDNKLKPAVAEKPPLVSGVDPPADKYAEHAVDLPLEKPHPDTAMDPPDLVSQEGPASGSTKKVPGRDEAKLQPTVEEQQQKEKEAPKSAPQKPSFLERLSGFFVGKKAAPQKNPDMPALEPLAEDAIAAAGEAKREGPSKPAAAHVRGGEILEQPTPGTAAARELPREAKGEGPSKPGAAEVRDGEIMEQPAPGTAAARELPQQTHQVGAKEITGHDSHAGEPPLVSGVDPPADKYAERAVDLPLEKPHPDTAMDPPDLVSQEGPASGSTKKVPGRDEAKLQPTVEEQQQKEKEAPKSAPQKPSFLERLSGFFVGKKAPPQKNPDMPALEPLAEDAIAAAGEAKREGPSKPAAAHVRDGEIMEQPAPGTAAARELPREAKGEGPSELASTGGVVHQPHLTQTGGHHPLSPVDEADTKQRDHVLAADTGATPISVALPGLEDLDSVLARMASGSKDLGLALARSYMELQATHLPSALQPSRPQIVLKPSKVEVPSVPLHRSAEPPLQAPRDVPLQELFKGRVRSMQDPEERKTLWSKGLEFDVALVFPNPDFEESQGLGIRKSILSLICGSWHGPDLAKVQRGVHPREAKRLYHDLLRDETASTQDAFLKAFDELRPWIRGRGREEDWPQSTGTPLTPQTQTSQAKMRREAFRCLSHGGSFRRVDLEQKRGGPEAERDCELGYISSAPEVLYQHTLDPSLSGATDLLSLIRNTVVALLARSGLIVELVFSSDFRWIYALISAGESALEELAAKHSYPRALDLECVDPEATEPCDAQYDPLSLVFQRHGCQEVVELLRALRPEERSSEATVPKGSSTPEDSVRDAYCWYLRSRLKGGKSAAIAKKEANAAWGKEDLLQSTFDRLCGSHGPEVVRVSPGSAQVRHFQRLQVQRLDGKWVTSHFSREDRIMLTMAAVTDACDIFKLINDGYVVDVLPCKGSGEQNQEGQACALQLAWRRHMGAAIALPALLGMGAQVAVAWASEDWWAEILLGYACLTSLWFSIALAAWKLCRKRLLLSRGDVPGSDGSFDICCGSGFIRPAESVSRPFGSTRRQFFGSLKRSLITSNIEEQANPIFSCLRHGLIKLICVTLALASMVLAACTCDLLPINDENFNIPQIQYNVSQHVVALIVVLEIWLFNRVFRVLSLTMTRWENHKLRSDFVHAYHLKAVSLQLINSYASLFYIAFYPDSLKMFEVSYTCSYANGWWNHWGNACRMARLNKQLTTILAAFCLKVAFRCVALLLFSPTKKASQSLPERSSDILDLDHVMSAPRFGDPETDLNVVPSCCFSAASEVIIVLGMFLLFLPASPWTGLLTFIFLQLSNLALARSRRGIPWRAGHPFCHSADLLEASDRLAGTAIQAISWLAMLSMAALLVWPAQLGWGRLNAVLLINEGSDLAPWGVSCALLLVCRFLPGRFVQCTPTAARLRTAETRLCRAMQKARQDGTAAPSIRSVRGRPQLGTDFRVRTPQQWEELSAKFT